MNRPILSLWPYLWRALLPAVLLPVPIAGVLLLLWGWRSRWLWQLARHVRRFRTTSCGRVVLHYAPEIDNKWDIPTLLLRCQTGLDSLTERFGAPLRGRAVVYLFADHKDIGKIFGANYGGTALSSANAIVVAVNNCFQESMRHEFAHLFSARWSLLAPPLLSEGLSVWLQETAWGHPIDAVVRPLLGNRSLKLPLLLESSFFFAEPHRNSCYVLAGSFTGFLIRRYGWPPYRKLFHLCDGKHFRAKFEKCFGVNLERAEWQWRNEIIVMEILNRRLSRNACS